ncbi:DeoR family transcriptional regulator [Escherichia coli]|nr:DeoR family transcriptional regulator [Escherichia coli]
MYRTRGEKIAERLCWILLQLYTGNTVSVDDVCQQFTVCRRTGRRDLSRIHRVTEIVGPGKVRLALLIRERVRKSML